LAEGRERTRSDIGNRCPIFGGGGGCFALSVFPSVFSSVFSSVSSTVFPSVFSPVFPAAPSPPPADAPPPSFGAGGGAGVGCEGVVLDAGDGWSGLSVGRAMPGVEVGYW